MNKAKSQKRPKPWRRVTGSKAERRAIFFGLYLTGTTIALMVPSPNVGWTDLKVFDASGWDNLGNL
jgi:hypothetical protein